MEDHSKDLHRPSPMVTCLLCNARLKESSLRNHLTFQHNQKEKPPALHKCNQCSFETRYPANLTKHVSSVHNGEKPFKCELCPYSSFYRCVVRKHIDAVHLQNKRKKCHLCQAAFTATCDLTR